MFFISNSKPVEKDTNIGGKLTILNLIGIEVIRDTSRWLLIDEFSSFPTLPTPVIPQRLRTKPISRMMIGRPVQFDSLDLSLPLCSLFLSNYDFYKKYSICLSEQSGCSAQLWASLVHYKSRL